MDDADRNDPTVRNLALGYPASSLKSGSLLIYLTARSAERGAEAVSRLSNDPQLRSAKALQSQGGDTSITFHPLDISSTASIHAFRDFLQQTHHDGIDLVINNAGIALQGFDSSVVRDTLHTNYHGTLEACHSFLPLIRKDGRLVNVSSTVGLLDRYPSHLRDAFHHAAASSSPAAATALMERFQSAVDSDTLPQSGFPQSAYGVSKSGVTAVTAALAHQTTGRNEGILINSCCPGFVNTDMTKAKGILTPDQGARTPVMLALADLGGVSGEFWSDGKVMRW